MLFNTDSCEHGNDLPGYIKTVEFLHPSVDSWFLKKDSGRLEAVSYMLFE